MMGPPPPSGGPGAAKKTMIRQGLKNSFNFSRRSFQELKMHQWIKQNLISYVLILREVSSALEGRKAAFASEGASVTGSF